MSVNKSNNQYIPVALLWFYIVLYFFTGEEAYADDYYTFIVFTDTFLLTLSILYYLDEGSRWGFTAKKSLLTVISLNVLTQLSFIIDIPKYYIFYTSIIVLYFLTLMFHFYNSYKNTQK